MKFGIYVHIPYCVQICSYCDFSVYKLGSTLDPRSYVDLLCQEIQIRGPLVHSRIHRPTTYTSLYFGGGTPSLLSPQQILSIIQSLEKVGFHRSETAEVTLEVNPGTLTPSNLAEFLDMGFNRFSVGAQTFDRGLLKKIGRKHSPEDTLKTLELLTKHSLNYNFDLIFGLPGQDSSQLDEDLNHVAKINPPHLSAYNLTVPSSNPLSLNRASDEEQAEMFQQITHHLQRIDLHRYELSNFSKPSWESKHNLLYWSDLPYWGVGLSAHSYLPYGTWGTRFWNPQAMQDYADQIRQESSGTRMKTPFDALKDDLVETLELHEAMTDFCHTSLRRASGINEGALRQKFPKWGVHLIEERLVEASSRGFIERTQGGWAISETGWPLSNVIFEAMTFLESDTTKGAQFS